EDGGFEGIPGLLTDPRQIEIFRRIDCRGQGHRRFDGISGHRIRTDDEDAITSQQAGGVHFPEDFSGVGGDPGKSQRAVYRAIAFATGPCPLRCFARELERLELRFCRCVATSQRLAIPAAVSDSVEIVPRVDRLPGQPTGGHGALRFDPRIVVLSQIAQHAQPLIRYLLDFHAFIPNYSESAYFRINPCGSWLYNAKGRPVRAPSGSALTSASGLLLGRDHHHHLAAFQARPRLDDDVFAKIGLDALGHLLAQFLVAHLAATEADVDLDLVALFQEAAHVAQLDLVVALVGDGAELHFLDFDLLLLLLRSSGLLLHLELELAEVHDAAHRRIRVRLDFHEIQAF